MHIGIGILFICMSLATASRASAQFPTTLSIKTNASFINDVQPSSERNTFTVTRLDTSAGSLGSITFQKCTISGSPVTGATKVGNCKWSIFTDGGVTLLRFSFNFRIPETDGHWGEFVLVNTNNFGRFARFWRPEDGEAIGTANGNVATGSSFSSATYRVVFESTWSPATHPDPGFPGNPHFSPLIGGVHNANVSFWTSGELASAGIENMAETGAIGSLSAEIQTAIDAGDALAIMSGNGLGTSTGTVIIEQFSVNTNFPLVTLTTMIAPSPDWFVGVHGLSLLDDQGQWVQERKVVLVPYDAGTDDGDGYTAADAEATPHQPIQSLSGVAPFSSQPIGTFTFIQE